MASGPENYRDAQQFADFAARHMRGNPSAEDIAKAGVFAQIATAYATMANAAATAIASIDPQGGLEIGDAQAWEAATGGGEKETCPGGC